MWSEIRDGLEAYEISKKFSKNVALETLAIAIIIGVCTQSLWVGVITLLVTIFLWQIPYAGVFMMIAFSAFYAIVAYTILSIFCIPAALCFGIAALVFLSYFGKHFKTLGH